MTNARQTVGSVRTAFLFAVAAAVALLVARRLHIDLGGLWVVLSAVLILKPKLAATLTVARDQLLGTTVGVVFGAGFALMNRAVISVALAAFLTALVCGSIPMLRTVTNIACVAAAIVILLPLGKPGYVTAADRFVDTLIGAAIALLVAALGERTYRWWPAAA
jgi:uncharacterized membrane protein YccC